MKIRDFLRQLPDVIDRRLAFGTGADASKYTASDSLVVPAPTNWRDGVRSGRPHPRASESDWRN
jgi:hypothetical protein